jgi:hypothetical protein
MRRLLNYWRFTPSRRFSTGFRNGYKGYWFIGSASVASVIVTGYLWEKRYIINADKFVDPDPFKPPDLPVYKLEEIKKHGRDAERIWVMYRNVSRSLDCK